MSEPYFNSNESFIPIGSKPITDESFDTSNLEIIINNIDSSLQITSELDKSPNFLSDQDLGNLRVSSIASPLFTEEMIINENIDYLFNDSNNTSLLSFSKDISLNYTKSNVISDLSSVFQSFEGFNLLVNSLPQSNNESITLMKKSFDSQPREFEEIKSQSLKIPPAVKFNQTIESKTGSEKVFTPIVNFTPIDLDQQECSFTGSGNEREQISSKKLMRIDIEDQAIVCSCSSCRIW
jgi:hypothetical protein